MKKNYQLKGLKVIVLVYFAIISYSNAQIIENYTVPGSYTWVCPGGVNTLTVRAWGGGGAGGGVNNSNGAKRGGGGGGGSYASKVITVVPGTTYTIVVGAGGTSTGGSAGGPGGESYFNTITTVHAPGGSGGGQGTTTVFGSAGGGGIIGVGDITSSGGNGSTAAGVNSGAGGSSAGYNGGGGINGNPASGTTGGTAPTNGGAGANGRTGNGDGNNAIQIGGGGGGASRNSGTQTPSGGTGGNGQIILSYSQTPALFPYSQDFSIENDFILRNGSQTNKWFYGSVAGNPANSIYVSSNASGTTNNYNVNAASVVHSYRDIAIPSGTTTSLFSFDWKANAESCCDYIRVWLVPTTFVPTAGTQITTGSGRIQVGGNLNAQTAWQTYNNATLNVSSFAGATMRLVFEWRNDGSLGSQNAAAIDNIQLKLNCSSSVSSVSTTAICSNTAATISVTGAAGTTQLRLYTSPVGGTPVATLNATSGNLISPIISSTTTYYVASFN